MPDEHLFTSRHIDQARPDFAAIEDELDFIKAQLARVPTQVDLARSELGIIFATAGLGFLMALLGILAMPELPLKDHVASEEADVP